MSTRKFSAITLCLLLLAAVLTGCGSSSKEGSSGTTPDTVASVGDAKCIQCHSANVDPLTAETIIAQYESTSPHKDSAHANNGNGCEACHGGGAEHFGVGPIPYPNPYDGNGTRCASCHAGKYATNAPTKFADSKHANVVIEEGNACRRCHSSEGAILGATNGLTGPKDVMDNPAYQGAVPLAKEYTQFKCETCHQHGGGLRPVKARNADGNIVNWNPSKSNMANDQFNLCTSCHGLKTFDGSKVMASGTEASGTVPVGHHENSWYRIIATTHLNNTDNATNGISGYVLRVANGTACFDCHGHEAKTETSNNPYQTSYKAGTTSIYRDWAMSGHAGDLLNIKYAAAGADARTVEQVDKVMNAAVKSEPWYHYDWSGADRQACQRCHTSTGASNFLNNPAAYDQTKNDFSHLAGWTNSSKSSKQREMLYCWGCHVNSANGVLRDPGGFTAPYNFAGAVAKFPNVGATNVCVPCHAGRESGSSLDTITDFSNASFKNSHYMAAAGLMYVKAGFIGFIDPNTPIGTSTYGKSLTSTEDGGALSSTHRKLGTTAINGDSHNTAAFTPGNFDSNGPCVTCHMQATGQPTRATSHTLAINTNAANEVCIKCHGTEVDTQEHLTTFLEEQAVPFQNALTLATTLLKNKYGIEYDSAVNPYFFPVGKEHTNANQVKDWTLGGTLSQADAKKLMGACFNINLLNREPAAYVHARTYARRLLYDTIDFLDDKTINMSTGATAIATFPAIYVKGPTANDPSTTESFKYLAGYNRTSGAWNALERP